MKYFPFFTTNGYEHTLNISVSVRTGGGGTATRQARHAYSLNQRLQLNPHMAYHLRDEREPPAGRPS